MFSENQSHAQLAWSAITVFAMDVDGVLTDGAIYVSSDGSETKRFSIVDGLGLVMLRKAGYELAWISGRASNATSVRAKELGITRVVQGRKDKITALQELAAELEIGMESIAYMGDDIIDIDAIKTAAIGIAPPNSQQGAIEAADYVTKRAAGDGAVREVCNLLLAAKENA